MELDVDVAAASIDQLIERRSASQEEANRIEAAWAESTRRHNARQRERNRALWIEFHSRLAASHARISADHEARVEELAREQGAA